MKLSEVINYATNHDRFNKFLNQSNINPDSVHELTAKITNVTANTIEHRIYFDFGNPGESTKDVRVIIDFDKRTQDFKFIQIDHPTR
ncbi:MAG: hypothetical protein ACTHK0_13295 [Ginsengibacter sp.]